MSGFATLEKLILNIFISAKVLLESGCNVSPQVGDQHSPLVCAILHRNIQMVELLLKHGANVNEIIQRRTPLSFAVTESTLEIVKLLVKFGADINKKSGSNGSTPFLLACGKPMNETMIGFLLNHEIADLHEINSYGESCLQLALMNKNYSIVKNLLMKMTEKSKEKTKEMINKSQCKEIETPLGILMASWKDTKMDVEVLEALIESGADATLRSSMTGEFTERQSIDERRL